MSPYSTWEEEVFEDAFPELGETYYLRPRGDEPKVVVKQNRSGGTYSQLQCTFWCYIGYDPEREITQETPFIVLKRDFYPAVLHDFIGRWDDTIMFKCKCESVGRAKRLRVQSMTKPFARTHPEPPSGPLKPAVASELPRLGEQQQRGVHATPTRSGSERGQPGAGVGDQEPEHPPSAQVPSPAESCQHPRFDASQPGAYCPDCGERVG